MCIGIFSFRAFDRRQARPAAPISSGVRQGGGQNMPPPPSEARSAEYPSGARVKSLFSERMPSMEIDLPAHVVQVCKWKTICRTSVQALHDVIKCYPWTSNLWTQNGEHGVSRLWWIQFFILPSQTAYTWTHLGLDSFSSSIWFHW